jgi:hypothetical protein
VQCSSDSGAAQPPAELLGDEDGFGDAACADEPGIVVSSDIALDAPEREALNRLARSACVARTRTAAALSCCRDSS